MGKFSETTGDELGFVEGLLEDADGSPHDVRGGLIIPARRAAWLPSRPSICRTSPSESRFRFLPSGSSPRVLGAEPRSPQRDSWKGRALIAVDDLEAVKLRRIFGRTATTERRGCDLERHEQPGRATRR